MKTFLKIGVLVWVISFSGTLAAQETAQTNNNLLYYYGTELFQWSYSMFGGLTLNLQNQSSITVFGIKDTMKNALTQYEDSNQQYRSYRGKTIAGNILIWGGLAAVLCGGAYISVAGRVQDNGYENEHSFKVGLGVMLGGLVTEMIGALVLESGQENIFNAVHLYNRHKISDYR